MKTRYKWILIIVVLIGIAICVKSCVNKKEADLTIAYIGDEFVNWETFEENKYLLEECFSDITGDGEVNLELMEISFNDELSHADLQNSSNKLTSALGMGAARVYIIGEGYVINNASYDVFEDISILGDGFQNPEGQVVAINIKGNKNLEDLGFSAEENLYLAVRKVSEIDEAMDKDIDKKHISAMKIAEYILK